MQRNAGGRREDLPLQQQGDEGEQRMDRGWTERRSDLESSFASFLVCSIAIFAFFNQTHQTCRVSSRYRDMIAHASRK
jgi:hypothetical protein